jgi:hypothetical protein
MALSAPVQLALFPLDEEERILLAQGRLYQALPEVGQQLVRAYLRAMAKGVSQRQADWLRETGLPKSTAHDALMRHEAAVWPAIVEATQLVCVRGAQAAPRAVVVAVQVIHDDLVTGRRHPSQLTSGEISLLREGMAMCGMRLPGSSASGVSVTLPDGTRVEASTAQAASEDEARTMLALLRAGPVRSAVEAAEAGGADSVRGAEAALEAAAGGGDREVGPGVVGVLGSAVAMTATAGDPGTEAPAEKGVAVARGSSVGAVMALAVGLAMALPAVGGGVGGSAGWRSAAVGGEGREEPGVGGGAMGRRENAAVLYVSSERTRGENFSEKSRAWPGGSPGQRSESLCGGQKASSDSRTTPISGGSRERGPDPAPISTRALVWPWLPVARGWFAVGPGPGRTAGGRELPGGGRCQTHRAAVSFPRGSWGRRGRM